MAGAIPAMIAYIVGARFTYGTIRHFTGNASIAGVVTIGYITNSNLLYLQATPMSDTFCVCFFSISCYYFVRWLQEEKLTYFIFTASSIWCITLVRYDGWALSIVVSVILLMVFVLRRYPLQKSIGLLLMYSIIAFTGIALWMIWCQIIIGNFLFFQSGQYLSQSQQIELLGNNILPTYHNIVADIRTYLADGYDNTGVSIFS